MYFGATCTFIFIFLFFYYDTVFDRAFEQANLKFMTLKATSRWLRFHKKDAFMSPHGLRFLVNCDGFDDA